MILVGLQVRDPFGESRWRAYVGNSVGRWHKQRWRAMHQLHEMIGPVSQRREPWTRGPDVVVDPRRSPKPPRRRSEPPADTVS